MRTSSIPAYALYAHHGNPETDADLKMAKPPCEKTKWHAVGLMARPDT
jgi:hypothetical protein